MKNTSLKRKFALVKESLLREFRIAKHGGNTVYCPICNSSFSVFATHGLSRRVNAKCWRCGALERHRLFYKYLKDKTDFFSGAKKRLLHFAPEKMLSRLFSKLDNIEYVPCDLFPERYDDQATAKVQKVDITNIPFAEGSFDVIFCSHVLEHIPDDGLAMRELFRVMKRGGWGMFQVPLDPNREITYEDFSITTPEGRQKAFGQHNHVRWYGKDYKQRLENSGFEVIADDFVKSFTPAELFKFGFDPNELIFFCTKK